MMTHARGGATVIGCVALAALIADSTYIAAHWSGVRTSLHYGFVGGFAVFVLICAAGFFLGLPGPTGTDRERARARTRRQQKLLGPVSLIGYGVAFVFGTHVALGMVLGEVAPLACVFVLSGFREAANPQHAWQSKA